MFRRLLTRLTCIKPAHLYVAATSFAIPPPIVTSNARNSNSSLISPSNHLSNISRNDKQEATSDEDDDIKQEINSNHIQEKPSDIILLKALETLKKPVTLNAKKGHEARENERKCYSSFLVSDDTGKIVLNQVVLPSGKTLKLPSNDVTRLNKGGHYHNIIKNACTYSKEPTAWWAYPSAFKCAELLTMGVPCLMTMDHLLLHRELDFVKKMQNAQVIIGLNAAGHTQVVQQNDLHLNGIMDYGTKHENDKWIYVNPVGAIPSLAEAFEIQYKVTNAFNSSDKLQETVRNDYYENGSCLALDGSQNKLFLKELRKNYNKYQHKDFIRSRLPNDWDKQLNGKTIETADIDDILNFNHKTGSKATAKGKISDAFTRRQFDDLISIFRANRDEEEIVSQGHLDTYLGNLFDKSLDLFLEIEQEYKLNELSMEGIKHLTHKISERIRVRTFEICAKQQKERMDVILKAASKMISEGYTYPVDIAEGGTDVTAERMAIEKKHKLILKQLQSNGAMSHKNGGKLKRSKKRKSLHNQPTITTTFKQMELKEKQKQLQQQILKDNANNNNKKKSKRNRKNDNRNRCECNNNRCQCVARMPPNKKARTMKDYFGKK